MSPSVQSGCDQLKITLYLALLGRWRYIQYWSHSPSSLHRVWLILKDFKPEKLIKAVGFRIQAAVQGSEYDGARDRTTACTHTGRSEEKWRRSPLIKIWSDFAYEMETTKKRGMWNVQIEESTLWVAPHATVQVDDNQQTCTGDGGTPCVNCRVWNPTINERTLLMCHERGAIKSVNIPSQRNIKLRRSQWGQCHG